jgi:4-hydroxybenzoate polyprenyltransferase
MNARIKKLREIINRDAIALVIAFSLGIVLGAAAFDRWVTVKIGEFLPALATLFAAFLGATYAFALNKHKDANEKRRRDLAAGNRAMFMMIRQADSTTKCNAVE